MDAPSPSWGELRPKAKIPAVRRGTTKRRARAIGMHNLWQMDAEDRQITYEISKVGRRA